jgi:DNA-binding NarL/FixJ family response regulator
LIIADDHQLVRDGFRRILESHSDMSIVAEASDGEELTELLTDSDADVLLLDISMPGTPFLSLMETLRSKHPRLPVLVVSMHAEEHWAMQALKAGAAGYLTKTHSAEELAEGIRRVHGGGRYITPRVAEAMALQLGRRNPAPGVGALSKREFEVLRGLGSGKMAKTVARELDISPKTVGTYRSRIMEKLGLDSNADLVRFVMEQGLLDP